jgi:hypothetical protein
VRIINASVDAVHIRGGCTGRIGRLDVVQYHNDGVKVGAGAHDLTIESGTLHCYAHNIGSHQDGIQVMGSQRVTFKNFDNQCISSNNAPLFINQGAGGKEVPTDFVCLNCRFVTNARQDVFIANSIRSGVQNSTLCPAKATPIRISTGAAAPVNLGNEFPSACSQSSPPTAPPPPTTTNTTTTTPGVTTTPGTTTTRTTTTTPTTTAPTTTTTPAPPPSGGTLTGSVNLTDQTWMCDRPVNLDSVTVTIRNASVDAVHLREGCTGRIGRLDVVQYHSDGIKVGKGAHDLLIAGGSLQCFARDAGAHQDGIQAMGGFRVTFQSFNVDCPTANNAAFFINAGTGNPGVPTDIVCSGCTFRTNGPRGVFIANSLNSGVRNSTICPAKYDALYIDSGAQSAVNDQNVFPKSC